MDIATTPLLTKSLNAISKTVKRFGCFRGVIGHGSNVPELASSVEPKCGRASALHDCLAHPRTITHDGLKDVGSAQMTTDTITDAYATRLHYPLL